MIMRLGRASNPGALSLGKCTFLTEIHVGVSLKSRHVMVGIVAWCIIVGKVHSPGALSSAKGYIISLHFPNDNVPGCESMAYQCC